MKPFVRKWTATGTVCFVSQESLLLDGQPVAWRPKVHRKNAVRFREHMTLRERIESCPDISGAEV